MPSFEGINVGMVSESGTLSVEVFSERYVLTCFCYGEFGCVPWHGLEPHIVESVDHAGEHSLLLEVILSLSVVCQYCARALLNSKDSFYLLIDEMKMCDDGST